MQGRIACSVVHATCISKLTLCLFSIYMGNVEMPMGGAGATLKVPVGTYEFGANLISSKVIL